MIKMRTWRWVVRVAAVMMVKVVGVMSCLLVVAVPILFRPFPIGGIGLRFGGLSSRMASRGSAVIVGPYLFDSDLPRASSDYTKGLEFQDIGFLGMTVRSFDDYGDWDDEWFRSLGWNWGKGAVVNWAPGYVVALPAYRCSACVKGRKICVWNTNSLRRKKCLTCASAACDAALPTKAEAKRVLAQFAKHGATPNERWLGSLGDFL
jgi:hypothetical protein